MGRFGVEGTLSVLALPWCMVPPALLDDDEPPAMDPTGSLVVPSVPVMVTIIPPDPDPSPMFETPPA